MNIPNDLRYTKEHEWVRLEGEVATIGITDYAQGELGDIVFIEVDTVDETVAADEVFVRPFGKMRFPNLVVEASRF